MRCERSSNSTRYARVECLSTRDQVTYSFCRMWASFHGLTEPWQRLFAQFTTPRCWPFASYGSVWAMDAPNGTTEDTEEPQRKNKTLMTLRAHGCTFANPVIKRFSSVVPLCPLWSNSIFHNPHCSIGSEVEPPLLLQRERPRADAAEDGDLPTSLVHRSVAVQSLGERARGRCGLLPGDEAGARLGAEAVEAR